MDIFELTKSLVNMASVTGHEKACAELAELTHRLAWALGGRSKRCGDAMAVLVGLALLAYIAPTPEREQALRDIATLLRNRSGRAVTVGFGPRFLHSTGQLHKGGPPTGCFLQLTANHPNDLDIPGWHETFGGLIDAQAAGDLMSLESHELPVARVNLGDDPDVGLSELHAAFAAALAEPIAR